jgi:hypothetical protein
MLRSGFISITPAPKWAEHFMSNNKNNPKVSEVPYVANLSKVVLLKSDQAIELKKTKHTYPVFNL